MHTRGWHDGNPVWSPDGQMLAFTTNGGFDVHVMNADGSGQRNLTRNPGRNFLHAWLPDGRIFSDRDDAHRRDIYLVNADGSGLRNLTRVRLQIRPVWSPSGGKVAFLAPQPLSIRPVWRAARYGETVISHAAILSMTALPPGPDGVL